MTSNGQRTGVNDDHADSAERNMTGGPTTLGNNVIYVTTDNGGTPVTKGVDYEGKAVLETGDVPTETFDLETIAVRGNSSADKAKKPYKLKFEDKQKPFGMKSDKTWILLANYGDWTLVRSMVAWDLGKMLDGLKWTPDQHVRRALHQRQVPRQLPDGRVDQDRQEPGERRTSRPARSSRSTRTGRKTASPASIGKSGLNYAWKDPDEFK